MKTKSASRRPWIAPIVLSIVILLLSLGGWLLFDGLYIPVLTPSGEIATKERDLFVFTVALSLIVIVPVFILLALFAWNYREGKTTKKYRPEWSENNQLEAIWWGIPVIIIIILSIITYVTSHSLDPYKPIESDKQTLEVEVVALQWKWLFIYPDQKIATINDLTIPVDRPVHFRLSADAPMSAFWIPALGGQIYSMNAMSSQLNLIANKPGIYKGYNTNINGEGYAKMEFDVSAISEEDFHTWHHKVAASEAELSRVTYPSLAKPSIPAEPQHFVLTDVDLYDSVIMKYMKHHHTETGHPIEHGAPEPFDEALNEDGAQKDLEGDVTHQGAHH